MRGQAAPGRVGSNGAKLSFALNYKVVDHFPSVLRGADVEGIQGTETGGDLRGDGLVKPHRDHPPLEARIPESCVNFGPDPVTPNGMSGQNHELQSHLSRPSWILRI